MVEYNKADDGGVKLVEKLSKSQRIVKKSKKPQNSEKFVEVISLKKYLPKDQSSDNKKLELSLKALTVF